MNDVIFQRKICSFSIKLIGRLIRLNMLQLSYIQESEAEAGELLDEKAGEWDINVATELFALADLCTEAKKKRPTMVDTLHNYLKIMNPWWLYLFSILMY